MFQFARRAGFTLIEVIIAIVVIIAVTSFIISVGSCAADRHKDQGSRPQTHTVYVEQPVYHQQQTSRVEVLVDAHNSYENEARAYAAGHAAATITKPRVVIVAPRVPVQPYAGTTVQRAPVTTNKIVNFPVTASTPTPTPPKKTVYKIVDSEKDARIRKDLKADGFDFKTSNKVVNEMNGKTLERKIDLAGSTPKPARTYTYVRELSTPKPVINNIVTFPTRTAAPAYVAPAPVRNTSSWGYSTTPSRSTTTSTSSSYSAPSRSYSAPSYNSNSSSSSSRSYSGSSSSSSSSYSSGGRR